MPAVTIKEYFAKTGSHITNDDARIIGPVLDEIGDRKTLKASDVVEAARSTNNPMHDYFEWDNDRAADRFREGQADEIIRVVRVRYVPAEGGGSSVLKNYRITGKSRERREATPTLLKINTVEPSVIEAVRELDDWRLRYQASVPKFGSHATRFGES